MSYLYNHCPQQNKCNGSDVNICTPKIINNVDCEPEIINEIEVICNCDSKVCGNFIFYGDNNEFLNICEINYTETVGDSGKYRLYFNNNIGLEVDGSVYNDIISKIDIN